MITVAQYWIAASYVLGIVLVAEQMRHPRSEWEAVGRNRRFWVWLSFVLGFHALGPYAAAAYLVGVRPRFRAVQGAAAPQPRRALPHPGDWLRAVRERFATRDVTGTQELALVAALLVFAASLIHSLVIVDHLEVWWLSGAFFAAVTCLQALWVALVCSTPLNQRTLVAGAVGNAALVAVWVISRTVGVPVGPDTWQPEAVGVVDVLSTLDELAAVILVAVVLVRLRGQRPSISRVYLRLATSLAGPLFIYSVVAAFAVGHEH